MFGRRTNFRGRAFRPGARSQLRTSRPGNSERSGALAMHLQTNSAVSRTADVGCNSPLFGAWGLSYGHCVSHRCVAAFGWVARMSRVFRHAPELQPRVRRRPIRIAVVEVFRRQLVLSTPRGRTSVREMGAYGDWFSCCAAYDFQPLAESLSKTRGLPEPCLGPHAGVDPSYEYICGNLRQYYCCSCGIARYRCFFSPSGQRPSSVTFSVQDDSRAALYHTVVHSNSCQGNKDPDLHGRSCFIWDLPTCCS